MTVSYTHLDVYKRQELNNSNINIKNNLLISTSAHLILPIHRILDFVYENQKGDKSIGSTLRGIGPAYTDKIARRGLQLGLILSLIHI